MTATLDKGKTTAASPVTATVAPGKGRAAVAPDKDTVAALPPWAATGGETVPVTPSLQLVILPTGPVPVPMTVPVRVLLQLVLVMSPTVPAPVQVTVPVLGSRKLWPA